LGNPAFSEKLLNWWDQHGRKELPWQHPRNTYRVWISEIMLQQTQVKTVIPYFNRFVERFPDISSLAAASTDEVLALWSGLGYYTRARNLLKTARICQDDHDAKLPQSPSKLFRLPGIGKSTANAIYSQALNKPAVILDGNVKRVLSRYFAVEGWPGKTSVQKQLWDMAGQLLPSHRGADYSQAIMDLGATVCTRTRPDCEHCPVQNECKAYEKGLVGLLPNPRPRLKISQKSFQMLILKNSKENVLLERRPPAGIWGGLWSLPSDDDGRSIDERLGIRKGELRSLPSLQHQLTHIHMTIQPLIGYAELESTGVECNPDINWFSSQDWPELGLPKPVRQLLEKYMEHGGK
jgi:A/G-specific adenine glycosylase